MPSLVFETAKDWVGGQNFSRTNFYSAREAPDTEDAGGKASHKTPPQENFAKRITNAALMEQLAALSAQLQLLAARRDAVEIPTTTSPTLPNPQTSAYQIPSVSAGL